MNAEEIRTLNHDLYILASAMIIAADVEHQVVQAQKECNEVSSLGARDSGITSLKVSMLAEIAAQLAEANKQNNPRWVWFNTGDNTRTAVDVQHIHQVQDFKRYVVLNNPFERHYVTVYEPLDEVCAKIGIPVEEK